MIICYKVNDNEENIPEYFNSYNFTDFKFARSISDTFAGIDLRLDEM